MAEFYGFCTYPHGGSVTALLIMSLLVAVVMSSFSVVSCRFVLLSFQSEYGGFDDFLTNPDPNILVRHSVGVGAFTWLRPYDESDWSEGNCAGYNQLQLAHITDFYFEITRVLGIVIVIIGVTLFVCSLLLTCITFRQWQKYLFAAGLMVEIIINPFTFYIRQSALCTSVGQNSSCEYDQGALVSIAGVILYFLCFLVTVFWLDASAKKQTNILGEQSRIMQQRRNAQLRNVKERERKRREQEQRQLQKAIVRSQRSSSGSGGRRASPSSGDAPSSPNTGRIENWGSPNTGRIENWGGGGGPSTPSTVGSKSFTRSSPSSPSSPTTPSPPPPQRQPSRSSRWSLGRASSPDEVPPSSSRTQRSNRGTTPSPVRSRSMSRSPPQQQRRQPSSGQQRSSIYQSTPAEVSLATSNTRSGFSILSRGGREVPSTPSTVGSQSPRQQQRSSKTKKNISNHEILKDLKNEEQRPTTPARRRNDNNNMPTSVVADDYTLEGGDDDYGQWLQREEEMERIRQLHQQKEEELQRQQQQQQQQGAGEEQQEQQQQQPWDMQSSIRRIQSLRDELPDSMGVKDYVRQIADSIAPMSMWGNPGGAGTDQSIDRQGRVVEMGDAAQQRKNRRGRSEEEGFEVFLGEELQNVNRTVRDEDVDDALYEI